MHWTSGVTSNPSGYAAESAAMIWSTDGATSVPAPVQ